MSAAGWSATARGRRELAAVGIFCLLFAVVPLVTTELYPFSRAPMFADAPRLCCAYAVRTPDGRLVTEETDNLTLTRLGLQRDYWGNPLGVGVGYEPPPTVDDFGTVAPKEKVVAEVRERLRRFPEWPYVDVIQTVLRPTDDGRIAAESGAPWRVANPYFNDAGGT